MFEQMRRKISELDSSFEFLGQSYSQEQEEAITQIQNDPKRLGRVFTFSPNRTTHEVFPDKVGDTTLEEPFSEIIDGICKRENANCEAYQIARTAYESSLPNTGLKMEIINQTFSTKGAIKSCYSHGYSKMGTTSSTLSGGGNLPLAPESALQLAIAIFNAIPKEYIRNHRKFYIYWIGCGYGEEILLIIMLAVACKFEIKIIATDISATCVELLQRRVADLGYEDYIEASVKDLYTTESLPTECDIVYTFACIEPIFTMKMFHLALMSPSVSYVLCNHDHCKHLFEINVSSQFTQWIKERGVLVTANLAEDRQNGGSKSKRTKRSSVLVKRWIYALELSSNIRQCETLKTLRTSLRNNYFENFRKQIGELRGNDVFTPPTGRTWDKIIHYFNFGTSASLTIPYDLYDPVDIESKVTNENGRKTKSRGYAIELQRVDFQDALDSYRAASATKEKEKILHRFWIDNVYHRALSMWKKQRVLNGIPDGDVVHDDCTLVEERTPTPENKIIFTLLSVTNRLDDF